jgi:FAD/FMN-containing dehydrogenase
MTDRVSDCTARLVAELGNRVHLPGSAGYEAALERVFFPDASRRHPPCVVQPRFAADVQTTMRAASAAGAQVTVRGGGLSSNCVADEAVMIDLSTHLGAARRDGDRVIVGGGATLGGVLRALQSAGLVIPVGIVGLAGFGLATRGGVGYLTRSVGLTLDHLVEVELVLPSGQMVRLSDASAGEEADLWWAVRGCAPCFGAVTSAVLRTHAQGPVFVDRLVVSLNALAEYFRIAPELPRDTTMGAVVGYVPGSIGEPVLFVYTACSSQDDSVIDKARSATTAVAAGASTAPRYRSEMRGRYLSELPEFAIPGAEGEEPEPIQLPAPGDARGWFYGKSVFTGPTLGPDVAEALAERIRQAPTRACRIDFQQTGGALADVSDTSTAFWGRSGEWNIPLNAIWSDAKNADACHFWARQTLSELAADTIGVYSVEVRPGFPETEREVEMAFGANLTRLRTLRRRFDPTGVLGTYPL